MKKVVVDTSIMLKLSSGQEELDVGLAKRLFSQIINGQIHAVAPRFMIVEFVNIMIRKKGYSVEKTNELAEDIAASGIDFRQLPPDASDLVNLMEKYNISAYDGLYVQLVKQERCQLLTDDRKLLKLKDNTAISLSEFLAIN